MVQPARTPDDVRAAFFGIPEGDRNHEIVDGALVERATPSGSHGSAQARVSAGTLGPFDRRPGDDDPNVPGGWWIATEVEVELSPILVVRPDVVGWRRERVPQRPSGSPVRDCPDWVCEVVSPSTASRDRVVKLARYHQAAIPHYWLVDPSDGTLTVLRWTQEGYLVVLAAQRVDTVRPEPFHAVELRLDWVFGED
ncbi:MAG: Uma2 family endonuclease [Polyangiaceae bacterium]|nr:Uma2 family endonuclease [Polyangiaceae bacterium]